MVSIAYLIPGVGLTDTELDRREKIANSLVPDDVTVLEAESGPLSIENTVEEQWAVPGLMKLVDTHRHDFDAFVIGCFGDPGLAAVRELTDKPIVGPAAASFHTAAQLSEQFSCLTILDSTVPLARRQFHEYHLDGYLASIRVVNAPVLGINHDSNELVEKMISTGKKAVTEDGAEALVPGCMSLSFMQVHDEIAESLGVPFIDPVTVGLETASMWARHGFTHSAVTYPSADRSKLEGLLGSTGVKADD